VKKFKIVMKKFLLVAVSFGVAYFSPAQVKFGFKAGANLSNVGGKDAVGASSLIGFYGGVQAGIPLVSSLSLQPELLYSAQGTKVEVETSGDGDEIITTKANMHLNYLALPVLLQYRHASGLFVQTGPQLSYLLSAKVKANGQSEDLKDDFKKTDLSWALGVGYAIAGGKIGFNVRYNFGLTKLGKAADGETPAKVYGRVLQAGVFYTL
jgi:hypothetical protein